MDVTENQPPTRRVAAIEAKGAQKRLDADAGVDRSARQDHLNLDLELRRDEIKAKREKARKDRKAEKKAARKKDRADLWARLNGASPVIGRRVMITGPILAPMTVAWIGQLGFAMDTLGWVFLGALVFAAAWELSTAFCGWMYHQARDDGDQGTIFRAATWFFAGSAGLMNYWHALPKGGHLDEPTPKAASFGAMSLAGIGLWELYTLLIHRKKLRADGKLPPVRPRYGLARWTQYPHTTWIARALSIKYGYTTVDEAWSAALSEESRRVRVKAAKKASKRAGKAGRAPISVTVVHSLRTRLSTAPLRTWTQPAVIWTPTAKTHPVVAAGSTSESTVEPTLGTTSGSTRESMVRTIDRQVVRTTVEPTLGSTPEPTPETTRESIPEPMDATTPGSTPESMGATTPESTVEPTLGTTSRSTSRTTKGRTKRRRRTRDELRVQLEQKVAEHYRNGGGEIQVQPLAKDLKATRKTIRELLDEMNVRPIRKATG